MEKPLETAISGSFKFKPEIDSLHEEFADHNVVVLEPSLGWLYIPGRPASPDGFRPMPAERGMTLDQIERRFFQAIDRCDFLYVFTPFAYLGTSAALEMGYAHARQKPIYVSEPLILQHFEADLAPYYYWSSIVTVASPAEASRLTREHYDSGPANEYPAL